MTGDGLSKTLDDTVQFDVFAPALSTNAVTPHPLQNPSLATAGNAVIMGLLQPGITFKANVSTSAIPFNMNPGHFYFLQTIQSAREKISSYKNIEAAKYPWEYALDVASPYGSRDRNPTPAYPGWPADATAAPVHDLPAVFVASIQNGKQAELPASAVMIMDEEIHMFVMYVPQGPNVEPVPLGIAPWWYVAEGTWTGTQFAFYRKDSADTGAFEPVEREPQYYKVVHFPGIGWGTGLPARPKNLKFTY